MTEDYANAGQRWRMRTHVLGRREFNAIRTRLPRAVRRDIEPVPDGHVGLVAQALVGEEGGLPLKVLYNHAPADLAAERLRGLERRLTELLL